MQAPNIEKLAGSKIKLSFIVTPEEAKPYIDEAVTELSISKSIPGFRPGKAPYAEIVKAYGEMAIWEHALERIVRAQYVKAVLDNDLDPVGSPEINVDKLTPNQDISFSVTAPVAPIVETMADFKKERVTFKANEVTDEQVDKALKEIRMMQRKEVASTEPLDKEGAIVIDLEIKKDNVTLEEGTANNYKIFLSEPHYIPGFTDQLIGMKEGEGKTFTLKFPEEHYQKHIAGKDVDFHVKAKQVFTLELPELNDDFAKALGQASMDVLKELIKKNISIEEKNRAREKSEIELLEKLVDESRFSDVAEMLINEEVIKMISELQRSVEERGMKMEDYVASIKKTRDELKLEFIPQALRRIRAATLIKHVAKAEGIAITDEEVDTEIDRILAGIPEKEKETRDRVVSPEYREYVGIMMRNRKSLDLLRKHGIKGYPETSEEDECDEEDCDCGHQH
jgi:trigger factor